MPKLPEVEIIKLFLEKNIVGFNVKSVEFLNAKSFIGDSNLLVYSIPVMVKWLLASKNGYRHSGFNYQKSRLFKFMG